VGPSDASYSFYGWMKDAANNISAASSSSIVYDTTAPTISSVSINSGDSTTTNTVVSLTISASDNLSGIAAYYASETSTDPSATATGWVNITTTNSLSSTVSFTLTSPGAAGSYTKTVYLWVKDAALNVSSSASDSITLIVADTTAPTSPSISINGGAITTTSQSVTLSFSASDDIGVTGYYLSTSISNPSSTASGWTSVTSATSYSANVSYTFSNLDETYIIYVWFKDAAGNVSDYSSDSIIDSTVSTKLIITDVTVANSTLTNGGTFSITLRVFSTTPVNWLNYGLEGPSGTLLGGGTGYTFTESSSNVWQKTLDYNISEYAPSGRYYYSNLSVKNAAEITSDAWSGEPSVTVNN